MKAIVCMKYGPPEVLRFQEVERPVPRDNEVLVQVHASSVNKADWIMLRGKPFIVRIMASGLFKPKNRIPGSDVAGRVEAIGKDVKQFHPGDEVFGNLARCGRGAYAEYVCAPENALALKPANITFEEAAATPLAGLTALQGLRDKGRIRPGQKVLIYGASGGVGTFAVQISKSFGAEVTAVCSPSNLDLARSIGADRVIDYTEEDFTGDGQHYDLILGANGHRSIGDYKRALVPKGIYVMSGGTGAQISQALFLGPLISMTGSRKMGGLTAKMNKNDLVYMAELLGSGKVKPVIERCFSLSEVPDAFCYFQAGHARGKLVIIVINEKS